MKIESVESTYARWAPVYDRTFGVVTQSGRQHAVAHINLRAGSVLEVGVGTGLSLRHYAAHLRVTGIDFSEDMLTKARNKVDRLGLGHVAALHRMDARNMAFPADSFDTVAAMHVLSVVPDPAIVMSEIARVLKPGGQVVITNHFRSDAGVLAHAERLVAPMADRIGWHSDFDIDAVLQEASLTVTEQHRLPPMGMMTFLVLTKTG